ncbi:MAG: hypothetical protein ABSC21_15970 [Terriglobia bacterium]|jgi:hypothetical protein
MTDSGFRFEHEMANSARNWLKRQGLMVKEEFYTPWGICDLVAAELDRKQVRKRLRLGQKHPIGPLIRLEILNAVPDAEEGQSTTLEELAHKYQDLLAATEVCAEIEKLITGKFVKVGEHGTLQKLNGWVPLHKRLVALELKLNRVEEALGQAISHQAFAEKSFVGFPTGLAERIATSPRAARFLAEGVGIVSVGKSRCHIVLHPETRRHPINRTLQMHCVERFWRTRIKGN